MLETPHSDRETDIAGVIQSIWDRDQELWVSASPGGGGDWLGWLDLPYALDDGMGVASDRELELFGSAATFNVLGMGGSSLTVEVLRTLFNEGEFSDHRFPALNVFDTVDPTSITRALDDIDLSESVFALSSKSGTTVEPLSLEKVFRKKLTETGVDEVASRFIAISDKGTAAARRAANDEFSVHVSTPSNVGGRYSALSAFGMFPASICGMPVKDMAESAIDMAEMCKAKSTDNPGWQLGNFMAKNALSGRDKVTIVTSPGIARLGLWLEQLLAESTGKNGRGLIPVAGEPTLPPNAYGSDRQFIVVTLEDETVSDNLALEVSPVFDISIPDRPSVAGEFFRWQFATAVAAHGIGVYPFDQPDVESAKELARQMLSGEHASSPECVDPYDAIARSLSSIKDRNYVALVAFLPESDACTAAFNRLRHALSVRTGVATTFGYGPRYLHSTGQLHKGGPKSCKLLAFTDVDGARDVEVPESEYTLGQLSAAQAAGDVQAVRDAGNSAELVGLTGDHIATIEQLAKSI